MASIKELTQIRGKIAEIKQSIAAERNRALTAPEIEELVNSRVDAWANGIMQPGELGLDVARHYLHPQQVLRAAFAEGLEPAERLVCVLSWLFPDAMKERILEAALPFADDGRPRLDIGAAEQDLHVAEVREEEVYCALEAEGADPGPRRDDVDPLIVLGVAR